MKNFDILFEYAIKFDQKKTLTDLERKELNRLWNAWKEARQEGKYKKADRIRLRLERYGCQSNDNFEIFHPILENRDHYWNRIARRVNLGV